MLTQKNSGLSAELYNRTAAYVVDRERQAYSDETLWAWLEERNARQRLILKVIPFAVNMGVNQNGFWRKEWDNLVSELNANQSWIDCIVWHLSNRGDKEIAAWVARNDAENRQLNKRNIRDAYFATLTLPK